MVLQLLRKTPVRTFVLYPVLLLMWELAVHHGEFTVNPLFIPLMVWGYLQYRLVGSYRMRHGGGSYGLAGTPDRLVVSGIFAYTRNPMYLGHLIFMAGLSLTLESWLGGVLTCALAVWFHKRVLFDEARLAQKFGEAYEDYKNNVARWVPGLF